MIERLYYYVELAITLCGFDGSEGNTSLGWTIITFAAALVIYAFYKGILSMVAPGEIDQSHIKYRVLSDEDVENQAREVQYHAH